MSIRICKFVALQWLEYGMRLSHNVVKYSQVYFAIYIYLLYVYILYIDVSPFARLQNTIETNKLIPNIPSSQ